MCGFSAHAQMRKAILLTKQHEIPCSDRNQQVEDSNLFIGIVTLSEINKRLKSEDITDRNVRKLYLSVRQFYTSAVLYIIKWFPLNENLVKDSQFVDFEVTPHYTAVWIKSWSKNTSAIKIATTKNTDDFCYKGKPSCAIVRSTVVYNEAVPRVICYGWIRTNFHGKLH